LVALAVTVNITEAVAEAEVFQAYLTQPIIIWFQLVVVVVPQVTKAVHKLEMVEMVVRLLELQDLADSVAQLERMRQLLPVELAEQEASQV
jgi:uncharacterized membrane protein